VLFDTNDLPILTQYSEDGFVDCVFKIDGLKSDDDHYYFNLLASHEGERVGMAVKLVKYVAPGFDQEMNLIKEHVYHRGVSFRSLGSISDRLLNALARLYGVQELELKMTAEEAFTAIALQQRDTNLEQHAVKLKLFGRDQEPFNEDDYYESFFNVDLTNEFASWNEKDPDYRTALIRGLRAA
jgi:hypothetical protein